MARAVIHYASYASVFSNDMKEQDKKDEFTSAATTKERDDRVGSRVLFSYSLIFNFFYFKFHGMYLNANVNDTNTPNQSRALSVPRNACFSSTVWKAPCYSPKANDSQRLSTVNSRKKKTYAEL